MSQDKVSSIKKLSDCGCCEGIKVTTPRTLQNRPGLSELAYRIGTHSDFKASMLSRLSMSRFLKLSGLRTRDDDDFSIALLDAFATVADVVTFYLERYLNESYLRSCTERLSVIEMVRLLGYKLRPGVAANAYLAFELEEYLGTPELATKQTHLDIGSKVQSTLGPGENAQLFETVEALDTYLQHNAIRPLQTSQQDFSGSIDSVTVNGAANNVSPGHKILLLFDDGGNGQTVKNIVAVRINPKLQTTTIDFKSEPEIRVKSFAPVNEIGLVSKQPLLMNETTVMTEVINKSWSQNDLNEMVKLQGWSMHDLYQMVKGVRLRQQNEFPVVHIFRQTASLFGYNAPRKIVAYGVQPVSKEQIVDDEEKPDRLFLDRIYESVIPGSFVNISSPDSDNRVFKIEKVDTRTRSAYDVSGQTTLLTLADGKSWWSPGNIGIGVVGEPVKTDFDKIRNTSVSVQSEALERVDIPMIDPVEGDRLVLNDFYPYLNIGQKLVVTGEPIDQPDVKVNEIAVLKAIRLEHGLTVVVLERSLQHRYHRESVYINANVALATHGETTQEILGSGNAALSNQRFAIKQPPVTYISAETPSGTLSTLELRINDIKWEEVASFYNRGPNEHIYVTKTYDGGITEVIFGDGVNGARLPTGVNNVRARYRKGIGLGGQVKAKQINQLLTRPLGIRDGKNPLASTGAADPESMEDARKNAPSTVLTLDRVVSLQDYADFARGFAGIAKAQAVRIWDGNAQRIFITVAGPNGQSIDQASWTYDNLLNALNQSGDPYVSVLLKSYRPVSFRLDVSVFVSPDYLADKVLKEIKKKLLDKFSFSQSDFGHLVAASDVVTAIQDVKGVIAVDLNALYRSEDQSPKLNTRLVSYPPVADASNQMRGAELLTLDPTSLEDIRIAS